MVQNGECCGACWFQGFPPILIQSGEAEVLRDETLLLAKRIYEAQKQQIQVIPTTPASNGHKSAIDSIIRDKITKCETR